MIYILPYKLFENNNKFIYFAHPINTYNTPIEKDCIDAIELKFPGFTIINPSDIKYQNEFSDYRSKEKENYMPYFKSLVDKCSIIVYLPFQDYKVGSGVYYEICSIENKNNIYQIDAIEFNISKVSMEYVEDNKIDVDETRKRIKSKYFTRSILLNNYKNIDEELINKIKKTIPIGSSILEISCGNAADSIELKKIGYNVTCTDNDINYVKNANRNGLKSIHHNTLEKFDVNSKYDLIYSRLGLHYFKSNELDNIFENLSQICKYIVFSVKIVNDDKGTNKEILDKKEWVSITSKYFNILDIDEKSGELYNSPSKWIEICAENINSQL